LLILLIAVSIIFIPKHFLLSQTKFAVIGDYGDGSPTEVDVADMINTWNVDFIITVGDNYYGTEDGNYGDSWDAIDEEIGQYYSDWIGNYQGTYGIGSTANKFFPVPGNHDWYHLKNISEDGLSIYTDYFTLPGANFSNSSQNERYYDFVWGVFISLC